MDITLLIIVIIAVIIVIACAWDINRVPTYKEEYDMNNPVHYNGSWGEHGTCACKSCLKVKNNNKENNMRKNISTITIVAGIAVLVASLWFGLDATEIPGAAKNLLYVSLSMVGMSVGGLITWVGAAYRER